MRVKRVLSKFLVFFLSLGFLAGTVWALDYFAVVNISKIIREIPVVGKMLPAPKEGPSKKPKNPLEDENKKLSSEIERLKINAGGLEKRLEVIQKEKQSLVDLKNNLQATLNSLQTWKDQHEGAKLSYEKLAKYYAEMKPEAAVKIMNNLSDEVIIGILQNLNDEQVAKILSAMDPNKAAGLVDQMKQ